MCPPLVDETVGGVRERYLGAGEKSKRLGNLYRQVAEKYSVPFIDLSQQVLPSKKDGYHLDVVEHKKISELVAKEVTILRSAI